MFFSVLCLLCLCTRLFICALWSPAGKVLTSWLSFVVSYCEFVTLPLVSWVRRGTWLYQLPIFAPLLTLDAIKDAYAIPHIEDSLHLLAGTKYISKLDLSSGYWQVGVVKDDKCKTAFQVGTLHFYQFNLMLFGLCNAPATFQRLMERSMGVMNLRDCLIYLDDIVVF